ncbi:MAG TPA: histidine kinase [Gemmatimonadaceae bacterium]
MKTVDTRKLWWFLTLVIWSVPPLILLADAVETAHLRGRPIDWTRLAPYAASCYLWAALTPVILRTGKRLGICRPNRAAAIVLHLVAILAATVLEAAVSTSVRWLVAPRPASSFVAEAVRTARPGTAAVIYIGTLLIGYALLMTRRYRERDLEAARLSAQLAHAQLGVLRAQLNPHFLFNSLNAVSGLVRDQENRTAVHVIGLLSDVLRHALASTTVAEVPLREEMEFVLHYLEIERVRFPDRLRVSWHVESDAIDALVPSLLLQPIVENALRHGIHQRSTRGDLEIVASRSHGLLRLVVRDDGPGFAPEMLVRDAGVGLSNTRARLHQLYGDDARLVLTNAPAPGGAIVAIELPFHTAPRAPAGAAPQRTVSHV